jgi:hypothetical protein
MLPRIRGVEHSIRPSQLSGNRGRIREMATASEVVNTAAIGMAADS